MSRASKYLRKKLAVGGMLDPEELKKLAAAKPKPGTGVAGPELDPYSTELKAQSFQQAMESVKANNPETVQTDDTFQQAPQAQLPKAQVRMPAQQQQMVSSPKPQMAASPAQAQQATSQPQKAAASVGITIDQTNWLQNNNPEYEEMMKRVRGSRGDDTEAAQRLKEIEDEYLQQQQQENSTEPQPGDEGRMGGGVNYGGTDTSTTPANTDTQDTDTGETTSTSGVTSTGGVTNTGSVSIPETRTPESIPKVEDPGPKPVFSGGPSQEGRGSAWEAHLAKLSNWKEANAKYQAYLDEVEEVETNLENEKNNSGTDNMANTDDKGLPAGKGGEPADLTGSGGTKTTGVKVSGSSGSGGAPVDIQVTGPTYTTPTVDVASVSADEKVFRSDFPEGDEGAKKYQVARAKEAQKLVAQGAEQPRRHQFPEGEAGDSQYNAAIQRFRETPLFAEGTVTEDRNVQKLGASTAIERTEDDAVTADTVTAAQMEIEPKRKDFETREAFDAAMAEYKSKTEVSKPTDLKASSMTASTIGQELPKKPMRTDFPEGEEGTAKFAAARESFNVQIEELRGEERPRFKDFDGNREAYNQALRDFQEAPLPVTEEVKAAQGSIEEGSKAIATQADATLSEGAKATAATRDAEAEEAALAGDAEFKESTDSTVKAVTGKVATVEEWRDSTAAEAREGELPVKPLPTDFEGGVNGQAYKQAKAEYNAELEDIRGMPYPQREDYDSTAEFNAAKKKFQEEPYMAREALQREAILGTPAPDGEAAQIMSMYDYNQSEQRVIQGAKAKEAAIKRLKNQGLDDEAIAQRLADNPDLVAAEMEDLPEDVRTTLSGLPKEALIDVQMESLMSGMEDGEVPAWARPALAKVEANLARRGMSASSVGRDALFNAIIQSAIPMAQANASAIQSATAQDKQIAADFLAKNAGFKQQMELANLSNDQQMRLANLTAQNQASSENLNAKQQIELTNLNAKLQTNLLQGKIAAEMNVAQLNADQQRAVVNAQTSAGVDMAKFNAAQQVELANSKFMQNMVTTKFNADQQAALQTATAMASMDMANLDKNTKLAVTNAQSFLQMDMANLSNEQQAAVLTAQQRQQALLSNQSAENAAAQFNAANQQQADQFMANLGVQIEQYNVSANTAREQYNATEKNRIAALNAGNKLQADQFEAQLETDIAKFNEQQDFQRDQWNAANAQAVEQSNVQWRRQANLADTAAQNAANQQNAQMSYNLTSQELTQVWQQLRDSAAYARQSFENEEQRKAQLLATAIGTEKVAGRNATEAATWLTTVIK